MIDEKWQRMIDTRQMPKQHISDRLSKLSKPRQLDSIVLFCFLEFQYEKEGEINRI